MANRRTLVYHSKPYMSGDDVKAVQARLKELGYFDGAIGGNYGPLTYKAVKAYQKDHGLTAEKGKVMPFTWDSLFPAADPTTTRGKFVELAGDQAENGSIYLLGADGQTADQITEALVKKREHGNAANIKRVLRLLAKRINAGYKLLLRAFDCSGLVMWILAQLGFSISDHNANGIYYDMCVAISKDELQPGDLVFKKYATKKTIYHVGVYMGDGTVTHAAGRDVGVIRESIFATGWNRYGRLKVLG